MSYKNRLSFVIIAFGLLPALAILLVSYGASQQMYETTNKTLEKTFTSLYSTQLQEKAEDISEKINLYLQLNPSVNPNDLEQLRNDEQLSSLTAQSLGLYGNTMVLDEQGNVLYSQNKILVGMDAELLSAQQPDFWHKFDNAVKGVTELATYNWMTSDGQLETRLGYFQPVKDTSFVVVASVNSQHISVPYLTDERIDRAASLAKTVTLITGVVLGIIVIGLGIFLSGELTGPIQWIAFSANQFLKTMQSISPSIELPSGRDALGIVSYTVDLMSKQVREEFVNLEKQIQMRTAELTQRTSQLETVARISHETAEILDIDELLTRTTELIASHFSFYHSGIFLIDEVGEFAILRASNSEGGQQMLARKHQLKVGEKGIVGYVAERGEHWLAEDVTKNESFVANPDLPYTRSEIALPMKVRGKVIGVLDVQSTTVGHFKEDDVRILQLMADQVALAVSNAHLLKESQETLEEVNRLYEQQVQHIWQQRLRDHPSAFAFKSFGVEPILISPDENSLHLPDTPAIYSEGGLHYLSAPIKLRQQVIGTIVLRRNAEQKPWTDEELNLVVQSTNEIASSLETAYLLEQIQRHANQERLISNITSKLQSSLNIETVMSTAALEIGTAVGARKVQIRLDSSKEISDAPDGNGLHPLSEKQA